MTYYQVSEENFTKVEKYIVERVKETGSNEFEATVVQVSEGAGVALATAHNALKQMVAKRILTKIEPSSRRKPITYIYNKDIRDFEVSTSKDEQLEYLKKLVRELKEENEKLSTDLSEAQGMIRILEQR